MVAFLRAHRANDGDVFHLLGEPGKVFADKNAGNRGFNGFELTAVGMTGLGIKRIDLAGAARHPEQDARPAAPRLPGRVVGQGLDPAGGRKAHDARRGQPQHLPARQIGNGVVRASHVCVPRVENRSRGFDDALGRRCRLISVVKAKLGTVEQGPEDVAERLGAVARGAAPLDVRHELRELAGTRPARSAAR